MQNQHTRTDFEELLIGSILYDDKCIDDVLSMIGIEDFYVEKHKVIFNAMSMMLSEGTPIDCFLLENKLTSLGALEEVGGLAELLRLRNIGFTPSSAMHYAKIISRETVKRKLHSALVKSQAALANNEEEILEITQKEIFSVSARDKKEPKVGRDIMPEVINELMDLYDNKQTIAGLSTGFDGLDDKTGGLMNGDLIIIGARPGMGKTIFGLNIFEHVIFDLHKSAVFFSMEMSSKQIMQRLLSSRGNVLASKFRNGSFNEGDIASITDVQQKIFQENLIIDDLRNLSAIDIRSRCRTLKRKYGLDLVVIDYLSLVKRNKARNTNEEIGLITKELRNMAQEINCPVILLSQLSRKCEERIDKRPITSDLRDSGEIEQDADSILFIYRDEKYDPNTADKGIAEIIIAKQRAGETGMFKLGFEGYYYRFTNYYNKPVTQNNDPDKPLSKKYSYKKHF